MEKINVNNQDARKERWKQLHKGDLAQKVLSPIKGDLTPSRETQARLFLTENLNRGLGKIETGQIRESPGRRIDFTSTFQPLRGHQSQRWRRVIPLFTKRSTPPIEDHQVGDAYFLINGKQRVSSAPLEGMKTIKAHVTECMNPVGFCNETDLKEVALKAEYSQFLNKTDIDKHRPELEVIFTSHGDYQKLECLIEKFHQKLEERFGYAVAYIDAMLLWFDMIYAPAVNEIKKSGILDNLCKITVADLFMLIWRHQDKILDI